MEILRLNFPKMVIFSPQINSNFPTITIFSDILPTAQNLRIGELLFFSCRTTPCWLGALNEAWRPKVESGLGLGKLLQSEKAKIFYTKVKRRMTTVSS